MAEQEYYPDGVARVKKLLSDTFGDAFKEYFDGEPEVIPESQYPCIMVVAPSINIQGGATGTDDLQEQVVVIMAVNRKDFIGADSSSDLAESWLRKRIVGQDPNSGQYLPQTAMYAVRKHVTLEEAAIANEVSIDFGGNIRFTGEATRATTLEAYITLTITRLAMVPSRD